MSNNVIYLVKVDPEYNNSKYYKMIPNGDNFNVEYGRLGNTNFQTASYPISQWDKKYNEKIKKGYENKSELIADLVQKTDIEENDTPYAPIPNKVVEVLVNRLQSMANETIKRNYKVSANQVTHAMIEAAQELINVMSNFDESLTDFNDTLVELFKVLPRKMKNVKDNLAQSVNDMPDVYQREQDLLDVMKGQVVEKQVQEKPRKKAKKKKETILEAMGIEMAEITSEEEQEIKEALGDISDRYFQAWKVINIKTQKQFDDYMDTVDNKTTKLLFHGSRSENWWSIINSGLILRPNAVITGKLYGYGIYFAPKARKSLGYTSIDGSYWAHGGKDSGFMGLYQVHYGNPYVVGNFDSQYYEYNYNKLRQNGAFDCLHAKAGVSLGYSNLKNDEIVIYQECQCTIKYLVELK